MTILNTIILSFHQTYFFSKPLSLLQFIISKHIFILINKTLCNNFIIFLNRSMEINSSRLILRHWPEDMPPCFFLVTDSIDIWIVRLISWWTLDLRLQSCVINFNCSIWYHHCLHYWRLVSTFRGSTIDRGIARYYEMKSEMRKHYFVISEYNHFSILENFDLYGLGWYKEHWKSKSYIFYNYKRSLYIFKQVFEFTDFLHLILN